MGEDAFRVLRKCLEGRAKFLDQIDAELTPLRAAVKWAHLIAR